MNNRIEIPFDWHKYYNTPAYFITYFGEIYFGTIWELSEYPDRFFIVQNDKSSIIQNLKPKDRTLEIYQQHGREIKDIKVIKHVYEEPTGKEIKFKELSYGSNQQFKKMFVFGAAASSFCVFGDSSKAFRDCHLNPPTGFEIFDTKYESFISQYPAAKLSIPLFESKDKNIEECIQEEWNTFKSYYSPQVAIRHINLQFYLQSLFTAISKEVVEKHYRNNLYSLFLNKFQGYLAANPKERISLISFNYDTILDGFMSQIYRYPLNNMDDYINWNERNILLFKPHGSCNWGWKLKKEKLNGHNQSTIANALYEKGIEPWEIYFQLTGTLSEVIANNAWGHEYFNDKHLRGRFTINKNLIEQIPYNTTDTYFPSLLMPYRDKDEMIMPYDHYNAMRTVTEQAEELYLIGWKGNEDLFNNHLKKHARNLKKIVIVNPQADVVKCNISKYIDLTKIEVETIKDFETFVLNHLDKHLN